MRAVCILLECILVKNAHSLNFTYGPFVVVDLYWNWYIAANRYLILTKKTRMHSSRMHTVRCSGRLLGEGCLSDPPPPVNRITDRCQNITLPQLRCGRQKELPSSDLSYLARSLIVKNSNARGSYNEISVSILTQCWFSIYYLLRVNIDCG